VSGEAIALSVGARPGQLTEEAMDVLRTADAVAGFAEFISWVKHHLQPHVDIIPDPQFDPSSGYDAVQVCYSRARTIVDRARSGSRAVLLSGGDAGLFGMAGVLQEVAAAAEVRARVIPGVSVAFAAAAKVGAPLTDGFAAFSLAHSHAPWEQVKKRITSALTGDFVLVLFEPVHEATAGPQYYPEHLYPTAYPLRERNYERIAALSALICEHQGAETLVAIVCELGPNERVIITRGAELIQHFDAITYRSAIIVGNGRVRAVGGRLIATYW